LSAQENAHLNPDTYKGEYYREYRDEIESLRVGSARSLGRIKPRGATAYTGDETVVYYARWAWGRL